MDALRTWIVRQRAWLALALLGILGGSITPPLPPPQISGELLVATLMSPTTYFLDANNREAGFEHDLVQRFAQAQGWRTRFVVATSLAELFDLVRAGHAHLAAAGLTVTERRQQTLRFGPSYDRITEWMVCRQAGRQPANAAELAGLRLEVSAGSSHAEHLAAMRPHVAGLAWVEVESADVEELFDRVEVGLADCTVADSDGLELGRNFHPGLKPAFALSSEQPRAWVLGKTLNDAFIRQLAAHFAAQARTGGLAELRERYFGHVNRLSEADVMGVLEKRSRLLPGLRAHFRAAQEDTGLDWRLIAAVAYQESQWDADAVSPTGVRGIMMLTEDTADAMKVGNRLDPRESILGGARYLAQLKTDLDAEISEPDRTWMALAAYNIGPSHFEDARRLAKRLGKDAKRWSEVKSVIHQLAHPNRAASLRYGFARGGEARAFAENVRIYYDILKRYEPTS